MYRLRRLELAGRRADKEKENRPPPPIEKKTIVNRFLRRERRVNSLLLKKLREV